VAAHRYGVDASCRSARLAAALPSSNFYPFDTSTPGLTAAPSVRIVAGRIRAAACARSAAQRATLILSGVQDLRTPPSGAQAVAALIRARSCCSCPTPATRCSAATSSGCAEAAVGAFFAGTAVQQCTSTTNIFAPTPVAPRKLAHVHAPAGLRGKPGRTLTAVLDAILDLDRQVVAATLEAEQELPAGRASAGCARLRQADSSAAILRGFSFVSGVALSGSFPVKNHQLQPATIRISGASAARGTVRLSTNKRVTGTLGGKRFDVRLATVKLSRAGGASGASGGEWPARIAFPLPGWSQIDPPARGRRAPAATVCGRVAAHRRFVPAATTAATCRRGLPPRRAGTTLRSMPNALAFETSPYLRQHAENPVDWLPWGPVALSRAREQNKPLLVSIGYSSCHWCHVMERESFEDPHTAELMNEAFVCVKVDREERPDVDALYMEAVQGMTGRGGWPLNVFPHARAAAVLRRDLLPAGAAPGHARVDSGAAGDRRVLERAGPRRSARRRAPGASGCRRSAARPVARADPRGGARRRGGQAARVLRRVPMAASADRRSSQASVIEFPAAAGRARDDAHTLRAMAAGAYTTRSAAGSPLQRSTALGGAATSRRCSTTTRCSRAPTCTAGRPSASGVCWTCASTRSAGRCARCAVPRGALLALDARLGGVEGPLIRVDRGRAQGDCSARMPIGDRLVRGQRAGNFEDPTTRSQVSTCWQDREPTRDDVGPDAATRDESARAAGGRAAPRRGPRSTTSA